MLRKGLDAAEAAFQVGYESPSQFGREYRRMFGRFPGEEQAEAVKDVLRTNNPSKRMADPLEIAKLAVYLASDDSAYVVGAAFLIDGGVTAISGVGARASWQRVEAISVPAQARDGSHGQSPSRQKTVGRDVSAV